MGHRALDFSRLPVLALLCQAALVDATAIDTAADGGVNPSEVTAAEAANPTPSPAKPERISAEDFARLPFLADPVLSPDGLKVAARLDVKGATILAILRPLDPQAQIVPIPLFDNELRWYRWANDERLLISAIVKTRVRGIDGYVSRLAVYDMAKNEVRYVGIDREGIIGDDVIHVADDGSSLLLSVSRFIGSFPDVYRIDLATGQAEKIVTNRMPIYKWFADENGVVRLGLGHGDRRVRVIYRESADTDFRTIARFRLRDDRAEIDSVRFRTRDGGGLILSNARTGRLALYEFDWETFEFGKPIFEHPQVDIDDFRLTRDGSAVEAVLYTDDRRRVAWFDPHLKELQAEIDEALSGRMNWITSASEDRTRFIVWTGTASDPGHYYYYHRPTARMFRLASPHESLRGRTLAPVRAVSYRSRDGLEIPAYLTLPAGREPRGLPLVMLPHGGPFFRDTWSYDPWVQMLANRGYVVLQPNFRGSTGYGKEFKTMGFGEWGGAMLGDIVDGAQWLVAEGIVDPRRVCIMGASYGGYAAMMGAIVAPGVFRCAISFAGVTDLKDILEDDGLFFTESQYRQMRDMMTGDKKVDLKRISPVNRAADLNTPLLLAHGTRDWRVPYRQAEKLRKALDKAKRPYEFLKLDDVGHGFTKDADHARFLAAVDAFLARHNPAN